ncbi:Replication initiator protein A domain-containing protein [Desulfonema limicola]|uniref:Replication initiator protein A domain-containing protein n=1 Tax=Desulfonema limicola TaxID=45656 RepID=A0A975B490_9BACT|nr:replication initiation protein [Desulfonema limicola]QTA78488.1 Replication initiator protein A domain-containing protein [Desulfonema limicola]
MQSKTKTGFLENLLEDLSEEEKKELPDNFFKLTPGIQKVIVRRLIRFRDPEYKKHLEDIDSSASEPEITVKKPKAKPASARPVWCCFPTAMCRTSVIHPINRNTFKNRPYFEDIPLVSNSWGTLTYTGPLLSTYDEDVLFAILALVENDVLNREVITMDGKSTYKYTGLISQIIRTCGKTDGRRNYRNTVKSLKRLLGAIVDKMEVYGRSGKGKRKIKVHLITNLLMKVGYVENTGKISFIFNPFFYDAFMSKNITYIDITFRAGLSSLIAKSLYRFCQSHTNPEWCGDWSILIDALNISRKKRNGEKRKLSQIKRLLENAVNELIEKGYFEKGQTCFFQPKHKKELYVKLLRSSNAGFVSIKQ